MSAWKDLQFSENIAIDWVDVVSNSTVVLFFKDAVASYNRAFSLHVASIYVNLLELEKGFTYEGALARLTRFGPVQDLGNK